MYLILYFIFIGNENQSGRGTKRQQCSEEYNNHHDFEERTSPIQSEDKIDCTTCNRLVTKRYYSNHIKSNLHKNNLLRSQHILKNVTLIESAFGKRVKTYRITSTNLHKNNFETPEMFFESIKSSIEYLVHENIKTLTIFKVNFIIHADFVQETKDLHNSFDFQTHNFTLCEGEVLDNFLKILHDTIVSKINNFEKKDSGWSLKQISSIDMNINKFNPFRGSSYIDLPQDIKSKKAIINVKNNDNQCFQWALLSAMYPATTHSDRVSSYTMHQYKLKFGNCPFPIKLKDINKIEHLNNISINVFGLEYNVETKTHTVVGPLYFAKNRRSTHINLLYLSQGTKNHYCYIKNLSRLVNKQITGRHGMVHTCDGCLLPFTSKERLHDHQKYDCAHVCAELPNENVLKKNWFGHFVSSSKLSFNNFEKKLKLPFVIYADFEAFLKPIATCEPPPDMSHTVNVRKHEVYSFGYYIKCSYNDKFSKYRTYTGDNCAKVFMEYLQNDLKDICKKNSFQRSPLPLLDENKIEIHNCKTCYICDKSLDEDNQINYDWYTGLYRGIAHSVCMAKFHTPNYIPVFLHNLSNYDAHFIVHAMHIHEGAVKIIPQNKEKYISLTKELFINNRRIQLRFLDSFKFIGSSLEKLAKNLTAEQFFELRKNYPRLEDFKRLIRKGVYPYEHITSYDSLYETSLPSQDDFYSSLNDSYVSNEDYLHAQDVWQHFNCHNMKDYSDLYLKTDVLLLTDVFENFRLVCLKTYDLDPVHYFTAPGLSWDAMLKCTKIELELLTDYDKIAFIKKGIRGGISQCSNRYAKANNIFMSDYNPQNPDSFLIYLDANNLYGWAMSQYLPIGGFEWINPDVNFEISETSNVGYILEVDLEYPDNLHDLHSDLPYCPESICTENSNDRKLVPNLNNKLKYIIHYRNLLQCLKNGLILKKVHRVLQFKQGPWLKKYIDLNTHLRTLAKTDFEKDFYKLMNNSVFGKTMENIEKRVNIKLVTHWENCGNRLGAQALISKPEFHSRSIFSENLIAIQLNKTKIFFNKPIYLGFCILDISKTLMYDFHYNYMKQKFSSNAKLLYTDTDSLIYQIFTRNFYEDIKPDLTKYFDTSDYIIENVQGFPQVNKKKLGYFKDEMNGKILKEFVGLRSKLYAMNVENKMICKAKGVNKSVTKKFKIEDYKNCLFYKTNKVSNMYRFKSIKHIIFTQKICKSSISFNDTKRYILSNLIDTLAWGHYTLRKQ